MGNLEGQVAIITGASAGIGRGIATAFAKQGARLALCGRRPEKLDAAAAELKALGAEVFHQPCDVMELAEMEAFVAATVNALGTIDVLVNNACTIPMPMAFEDFTKELWDQPIRSGLEATFQMMRLSFPYLKDRRGRVINFSSVGAIRGSGSCAAYAAAKGGIEGLSHAAALEWAKYGIRVNCISPLAMSEAWADFMTTLPAEMQSDPAAAVGLSPPPLGFIGDAERDIGSAVVFLASEQSRYVTGHVLPVDGGQIDLGP